MTLLIQILYGNNYSTIIYYVKNMDGMMECWKHYGISNIILNRFDKLNHIYNHIKFHYSVLLPQSLNLIAIPNFQCTLSIPQRVFEPVALSYM